MPVQYYGPKGYILRSGHEGVLSRGLPLVEPTEPSIAAPHEKLFIRTHQAMEIWFDQMNDELEYARTVLSQPRVEESQVSAVARHVARCTAITGLLTEHMGVLMRAVIFPGGSINPFPPRSFVQKKWTSLPAGILDRSQIHFLQ